MTEAGLAPDAKAHGKDFFDRVRRRLSLHVPDALHDPTAPAERGDLDLNPEMWRKAGGAAVKPAAVLFPGGGRPGPTGVPAKRTDRLPDPTGHTALPGGRI